MAEGLPVPALPSSSTRAEAEPATEPEATTPPATAPEPPPVQEAKSSPEPAPEQTGNYEEGLAAFESGDYQGAASIWQDMLSKEPSAYSISVVVACQIDTVKNAFSNYGAERKVFTVPLELSDGRSCYRVCLGTFPGKSEARSALGALPPMLQTDLIVRSVKSLL
jgi:septal ring-binding cell division protein DamX